MEHPPATKHTTRRQAKADRKLILLMLVNVEVLDPAAHQ
jgi:hypothetical protein